MRCGGRVGHVLLTVLHVQRVNPGKERTRKGDVFESLSSLTTSHEQTRTSAATGTVHHYTIRLQCVHQIERFTVISFMRRI